MKNTRIRRTRIPVGRTSPSTRLGATIERPADVPLGDSDRDVAQPRSGCLSSRFTDDSVDSSPMQGTVTVPVPVSSRGPIGSHPCCCLRRRRRCQPTYPGSRSRPAGRRSTLRSAATAKWNCSSQQTAAAALTMRSSTSPTKVTRILRSHSQRTLSSPISTQLLSARLFTQLPHTAKYVRSLAWSTLICRLSRNFFASPLKTCASHVSTPDLTDSHKLDLSGRARTQAATAYTWCQKINTSLRADPLTTATPQVKVHANTWRAVLTIAASPYHATGGCQNNKTI